MYNVKGEIIMTREANPIPQGKYVPATRFGNMIFTAGMTPRNNGVLLKTGKIKATDEIADYKEAVVQAAKNALTAAKNKLENGEKIAQIMQITVYVNSETDFTKQPKIADFASEYFCEELGESGGRAYPVSGKPKAFQAAADTFDLNIYDRENVQNPSRYFIATDSELNSTIWRVDSAKPNGDDTQTLSLTEYSDSIYP